MESPSFGNLLVWSLAASAVLAPAFARSAVVPGVAVDGPSAAIVRFGSMDVAPDGTAAIGYLKRVGPLATSPARAFVVRWTGTAWSAPEQVDAGLPAANASGRPSVSVANGGRIVVVYRNGTAATDGTLVGDGTVQSAIRPSEGAAFQPFPVDTIPHKGVEVDMNAAGVGYAVGSAGGSGDVHAWRLAGTTWTKVAAGGALDLVAGQDAGDIDDGQNAAHIVVTPDGNAAAIWSEMAIARYGVAVRITGTSTGTPQKIDVPTLSGAPAAGFTDMTDIAADGTGRVWLTFRQLFTYPPATNIPRALARPLDGATLGTAQVVDGLGASPGAFGAEFPRIAVNASGAGALVTPRQTANEVRQSILTGGTWATAEQLDAGEVSAAPAAPSAAIGDDGTLVSVWRYDPGGTGVAEARARIRRSGVLGTRVTLSNPALGPVAFPVRGLGVGVDRTGNGAIAWTQGAVGSLAIVAARTDGPPPPAPQPPLAPIPAAAPTRVLSGLAISSRAFRALTRGGSVVGRRGVVVKYRLSDPTRVVVTVLRPRSGRLVNRACVPVTPKNRRRPSCRRTTTLPGRFTLAGLAGENRFRFSGRLNRRSLAPGHYILMLSAPGVAPISRAFTILK